MHRPQETLFLLLLNYTEAQILTNHTVSSEARKIAELLIKSSDSEINMRIKKPVCLMTSKKTSVNSGNFFEFLTDNHISQTSRTAIASLTTDGFTLPATDPQLSATTLMGKTLTSCCAGLELSLDSILRRNKPSAKESGPIPVPKKGMLRPREVQSPLMQNEVMDSMAQTWELCDDSH